MDFSGEFKCKLDSKNRLVLPAKIRDKIPEESRRIMKLSKGFENCLTLYPLDTYQKISDKFKDLDRFNNKHRRFQRQFISGFEDIELNENCRFLIPKNFINLANLKRDVTIIGVRDIIEIWDSQLWLEETIKDAEEFSKLAEEVMSKKEN